MSSADLERGGGAKARRTNNIYYVDNSDQEWTSWLIPAFVAANVAVFVVAMYINNCPKSQGSEEACMARFLGRLSFQPLKENPLFGPSSSTWAFWRIQFFFWSKFNCCFHFIWINLGNVANDKRKIKAKTKLITHEQTQDLRGWTMCFTSTEL